MPEPGRVLATRIDQRREVAADVVELTLVADAALPEWSPGAHIDVVLPSGMTRQYSLCGDPADAERYRIAVLRSPTSRGGSEEIHRSLQKGDTLTVRGPRNNFELVPSARYVFIAGGIGVTPILPMIRRVAESGVPWHLHYGGRRRTSMAYLSTLDSYGSHVSVWPEDECGALDLDAIMACDDGGTAVYCCGPEPLLRAVEEHFVRAGRGPNLHIERFTPAGPPTGSGPQLPIEVVLARSERVLTVPSDKSILDVLLDEGVDVLFSCQEGTCGSCITAVLEGDPLHNDSVLSPSERDAGDQIALCVSRSTSARLVLDL